MDIKDCKIDMVVRAEDGRTGKIVSLFSDGEVRVNFAPGRDSYKLERASDLTPVSDPCTNCQKLEQVRLKVFWEGQAAAKADVGNELDVLRKERDNWKADAEQYCRNATYWWEELEKLQKEALAERTELPGGGMWRAITKPDKLLMSQAARRVIEFLEASGPRTVQRIAGNLDLPTWQVLDAIIEAREAGRIRLVGEEYSVVRD